MYKSMGDGAGISRVSRRSAAGRVSERARFSLGWVRLGERGRVRSGRASGSYGFGSGEKGFPLQSPPLLEKHQPDACAMEEMGRKGIEPKAMIQIQRGAAGCQVWKSATFSGAFSTFLEYSQVFPSMA